MAYGRIISMDTKDGIGIVTFDMPGSTMNTWSEETVAECRSVLDSIGNDLSLRGVVFTSGKPDNFFAGADLHLLDGIRTRDDAMYALEAFHSLFNRISALSIPSVAAIRGHCVGGGFEFALACSARIAQDAPTTVIGLPECKVGLFPGGGGSQRLPRLIGYPAIELILRGRLLPAAEAQKTGMIDRLVPPDGNLLDEARSFIEEIIEGTAGLHRPVQDFSQIDVIMEMARTEVMKATKGREIPGPLLAIKSIQEGVKQPLPEALEIEKNYFAEAVLSREAKGSIHTFFLKTMTDKPRAMMTVRNQPRPVRKAAVLGFGTMGRGIALDIARSMTIPVIVKDLPEALEPGMAFLRKTLEGMAEKKKLAGAADDLVSLIQPVSRYPSDMSDVDIVIEAVFEERAVKKSVYEELMTVIPETCIVASNTSSLPVSELAKHVTHPARFAGLHFFSPVWRMQLVEIVRGDATSQETVDDLLSFVDSMGKRPIICRDNPGFVVNATLFPYFLTALRLIEEGNTIETVDGAMTRFGMPVGPIKLIDNVGIDVMHKIFMGLAIPQETIRRVVEAGRLGVKKSGAGFFTPDGSVDPTVLPLIFRTGDNEKSEEVIQEQLLSSMVTAGRDLVAKEIVSDARMIDAGMIWGTGFPPEKGGPMKWSDLTGMSSRLFGKTFYE